MARRKRALVIETALRRLGRWTLGASAFTGFVAISLMLSSCGGKKKVAAAPRPPAKPRADLVPLAKGSVPRIRVLLKEKFSSLRVEGAEEAARLRLTPQGARIRAEVLGGGKAARSETGYRFEPHAFQTLRVDGVPYRGAVEVFVNPVGDAVAVNDVSVEEYLKGVVPNEIGPRKQPQIAAIEAQAVAARTFTLANRGRFDRLGFDLYDDSRSQAYTGVTGEHELSSRAVRDTAGRVAIYDGRPIMALYCSTCGGKTANYQRIFLGSPVPYLEGGVQCPDGSSPYHDWEETVRIADLRETIQRYAPGIGRLRSLDNLTRDDTGRVVALTFKGDKGAATVRGIHLRTALALRSNWILDLKTDKDKNGDIRTLTVRGKGWGHGVGLCQYGALELARQGKDYTAILKHYYPGIRLEKRY